MGRPEQNARRRWADLAEDLAGVGYWWMDATGHGLRLSPSLFRIFGFEDGAEPTLEDVLSRVHPADQDAVDEALRLVLSGRASSWSARVIRPSGEVRHVQGSNDVQIGAEGEMTGVYAALIDQTEHVRITAELGAARDAARAAAAATIDVLSGVNQALRTPLGAILDAAARLSERCAGDEAAIDEVDRFAAAAAAVLTRLDALVAVAGPRSAGPDVRANPHQADGPNPGSRLLIVDDHRVNREIARAMLAPWDLRIAEAPDGRAAVAAAQAEPFDLILMDVRMPGLDGPGAMVRIRQGDGPNRETAILAFSADADHDSLHGLVERGFDGVVSKPILAAELVAAVARWTNGSRPQGEATRQSA